MNEYSTSENVYPKIKYNYYNYENSRLSMYATNIFDARRLWKALRLKVELDYDPKLVKKVPLTYYFNGDILKQQLDYIANLKDVSIRALNNWFGERPQED